jgi:CubicO group peptidase (beta-lactamase class C family)
VSVRGTVAPGFEPVREALAALVAGPDELGAGFAAVLDGRVVVDLVGGHLDRVGLRPWRPDQLCMVTSCSKGVLAAAVLATVREGRLGLDAPVAEFWPNFAAAGKAGITVRELLNHRAGLAAVDTPLLSSSFLQPAKVAFALERQAPLWAPGTAQGYGATAWGMYVGELLRRVWGAPVEQVVADLIAGPLQLDLHLGVPPALHGRVAPLHLPRVRRSLGGVVPAFLSGRPGEGVQARRVLVPGSIAARSVANPQDLAGVGLRRLGEPALWPIPLPWVGVQTTAASLARLYGSLATGRLEGREVWPANLLAPLWARQSWSGDDLVFGKPLGFSQGFMKEEPGLYGPHPEAFGHTGISGALSFADPVAGLGWAFVPNQMQWEVSSPARRELVRVLYRCVEASRGGGRDEP